MQTIAAGLQALQNVDPVIGDELTTKPMSLSLSPRGVGRLFTLFLKLPKARVYTRTS